MKNPKVGERIIYKTNYEESWKGTITLVEGEVVRIKRDDGTFIIEHRTHLIRLKKKEKPLKTTFICEWWPRFNADKTADIVPADTHGSDFKNEDLKEFQYKRTKVTVEILGE